MGIARSGAGRPHNNFQVHRLGDLFERGQVAGLLPFEARQQLRSYARPPRYGPLGVSGSGERSAKLIEDVAFSHNIIIQCVA
jgi:hypothetical protein